MKLLSAVISAVPLLPAETMEKVTVFSQSVPLSDVPSSSLPTRCPLTALSSVVLNESAIVELTQSAASSMLLRVPS